MDVSSDCLVIIDPGDPDISELVRHLKNKNKKEIFVLLTHEHADHCAGVNPLYRFKAFELICTSKVSFNIGDPRRNLSKYFEHTESFEVSLPVRIITDQESISIGGINFTFIETPGHSPGSTCIFFNKGVFTGDTILNDSKIPLNLPGSDKGLYEKSLQKLKKYLTTGMTVYPGHGEAFIWNKS